MDQLKIFVFWYFLSTLVFIHCDGRSMPTGSLHLFNNIRDRRSLSADVILPQTLTNAQLMSSRSRAVEMLVKKSTSYGKECPKNETRLSTSAPSYAKSNCPWYYKLQHNPDRFPTSLPLAVSKCRRHCLGLENSIIDDFICDYVYTDVTVIMKEYHNDVTRFTEKVEQIPVGSTCVRKKETT